MELRGHFPLYPAVYVHKIHYKTNCLQCLCLPDKLVETVKVLKRYGKREVTLAGSANASASFPHKVRLENTQATLADHIISSIYPKMWNDPNLFHKIFMLVIMAIQALCIPAECSFKITYSMSKRGEKNYKESVSCCNAIFLLTTRLSNNIKIHYCYTLRHRKKIINYAFWAPSGFSDWKDSSFITGSIISSMLKISEIFV